MYSSTCLVLELFERFTEKVMSSLAVKVPCSLVKWRCIKLSTLLRKANKIVNVLPPFYFGWIDFFQNRMVVSFDDDHVKM